MTQERLLGRAAWAVWALAMAVIGSALFLAVLNRGTPEGDLGSVILAALVVAIPYPSVGALIAWRRPANPVGWTFLIVGLLQGLQVFGDQYGAYGMLSASRHLPLAAEFDWSAQWTWMASLALVVTILPLIFPDGRPPTPRWRWLAWLSGAGILLVILTVGLYLWPHRGPGLEGYLDRVPVPVWVLGTIVPGFSMIVLSALGSVVSLFVRLRRARGQVRQQIKWFVYGGALAFAFILQAFLPGLPGSGPIADVRGDIVGLGILAVAVGAGIGMLRHRLYDIDVVVKRTLVYGLLTATLVGTYFGSVVLLQLVFRSATGEGSSASIVVSTLGIAALFQPMRRRIQGIIDRRFYRRRYDAERTLAAFGVRMRDEVDLERVREALVSVVQETMQPANVSLWLRPAAGREAGP